MPVSPAYRPDPEFEKLGPEFADPVAPAPFPIETLRYRNQRAAATLGLDTLTAAEWLAHFARFQPLPDNQPHPLALRYHGHQFGTYNAELGDGRGFLFAQMRETGTSRLLDLGTKGSGKTPYSRFGDGRLTLKGGVREVLATEMLEALGVPTSKSFALVETGEALQRNDEPSPTRAAVLTRLSWSNVRFGTFQRHAYHDRPDLIGALVRHCIDLYYPEAAEAENPAAALLAGVTRRTARLLARWMTAGFVHGVLNTDNMNINGESFDYGPYRFLPHNNTGFVAAYFDHAGRYAYGRQPQAVAWNLRQLAGCLTLASEPEPLSEALNGFGAAYTDALAAAVLERLGLARRTPEADVALADAAFTALAAGGQALGWEPFFFDWFGGPASEQRAMKSPRSELYGGEAFVAFRRAAEPYQPVEPARLSHGYFARTDPETLLYDDIEALWAPIAERDDWSAFAEKIERIGEAREAYGLRGDLAG